MQLKNITKEAIYDSIKHKVYPTNLKVLEQKTTMKNHIAKLVKVFFLKETLIVAKI